MWSLDVDPSETRLATGSSDAELRVYQINAEVDEDGDDVAMTDAPGAAAGAGQQAAGQGGGRAAAGSSFLAPMGSVRRQAGERAETVRYASVPGPHGGVLLTCQSAGKVTEVYRVRSEAEAAKKMKRRRKRRREKAEKREKAAAAGGQAPEEEAGEVRRGAEMRRQPGAAGSLDACPEPQPHLQWVGCPACWAGSPSTCAGSRSRSCTMPLLWRLLPRRRRSPTA